MSAKDSNVSRPKWTSSKKTFSARVRNWRRGKMLDRAERLQAKAASLIRKAYQLRD